MSGMDLAAALRDTVGPVELLAEDGTSQVFRGAGPDGPVAIKVCRWPAQGVQALTRFATEVRRLTKLSDDGCLVPLLGSGVLPDGHAYVVMRLCEGGSIDKYLPLPVGVACDVMATIGRAVAALHEAGVVHGAITPRKIIVRRDGTPQLGLFGVDAVTRPPAHVVIDGTISLAYVAPEIVHGRRPEPGADVYSLGAVLYGLLTGRPPHFPPDRDPGLMEQVELMRLPAPAHPAVPAGLLSVIGKALRFEADERYRDADEFVGEVARFRNVG